MRSFVKKLMISEYGPFETIQLLFETFFNIVKNKGDIRDKKIKSHTRHPVYFLKLKQIVEEYRKKMAALILKKGKYVKSIFKIKKIVEKII